MESNNRKLTDMELAALDAEIAGLHKQLMDVPAYRELQRLEKELAEIDAQLEAQLSQVINGHVVQFFPDENNELWWSVKLVCDTFGLNAVDELRKIEMNRMLSEKLTVISLTLDSGKIMTTRCLPKFYFGGWVFLHAAHSEKFGTFMEDMLGVLETKHKEEFGRPLPAPNYN